MYLCTNQPTGVAAVNIKGGTLHSTLGLGVNGAHRGHQVRQEIKDRLCRIKLMIIDEISMLDKKTLSDVSDRLCMARSNQKPFGGCNVALVGDFYQLAPVAGSVLYRICSRKELSSKFNAKFVQAYALWEDKINCAVVLDQVVRQQDIEFLQILTDIREGNISKHLQVLNSRKINPPAATLIVVPDNQERIKLNHAAIAAYANQIIADKPPIYMIMAAIKSRQNLNNNDLTQIFRMRDDQTDRLATVLFVYVGMPVTVTQNIDIKHAIANGTEARVVQVVFADQTQFNSIGVILAGQTVNVIQPDKPPSFIVIQLLDEKSSTIQIGSLPAGLYPLKPYKQSSRVTIERTRTTTTENVTLSIGISQFPIVPMFAVTGHKVQGKTYRNGIVIGSFGKGKLDPAWAYVTISRVPSLDRLWLLEELSETRAHRFHPPKDLINEETRLKQLSNETIQRMS